MRNPKQSIDADVRTRLRALMRSCGLQVAARIVGVDERTFERAAEGALMSLQTRQRIKSALPLLPESSS